MERGAGITLELQGLDFFQVTILAVLQGATEFLPISSSGHLILPSLLFAWNDQGLTFDVAVHVGTLFAVLIYFRDDLQRLVFALTLSIFQRKHSEDSKLAWMLLAATIPAGLCGLLFASQVEQYGRSLILIGTTSIGFGLLLFVSDRRGSKQLTLADMNWKTALLIGFSQILALIPGTSRSGVTMTAALFCNLDRAAAARFSFLLAIPIITASGLLRGIQLLQADTESVEWLVLLYAIFISAVVAYLCIHYFLQLIERFGFLPFVIYRVLLGIALIFLAL
ncbi:MAG: undecaprenyl-diphosphate phosphatase [Proteobacteria bacterium]|jgi:undecaprenyl-diphosphatase|nr:undecaprenyl-diphosphate phosphatase [Pseudomonadota bacterium]MDA1290974.1 undecaprenyl-diphosphate phosphatase [Pseudomonadota bacterium]